MGRYIHGERDGIHIIDLLRRRSCSSGHASSAPTSPERAGRSCSSGTKKQARDAIQEWAERSGMPFVNQRWLGGLLTNFSTISKRIDELHDLTSLANEGQLDLLPTKERMARRPSCASSSTASAACAT